MSNEIETALRMGILVEADDPNLRVTVTTLTEEQITWVSSWLAGEGFGRATAPEPVVLTDGEREAWRSVRSPGWFHDIGYALQNVVERHRYEIQRKGYKPDDPGWHECSCGAWQGYWSGFEPHVADMLRALVADRLAADCAAHDPEEVAALREAVAHLTRWQLDAREALNAVKDRMDEHAYDELATVLDDGVSDHLGEPYAPADRAAHEALRADIDSQVQGMEALLSALTYADGVPEDPMLQSAYWSGFAAAARSVARHLRAALAAAAPAPPQDEQ